MPKTRLRSNKKGQLTGESKSRQLMNYVLSWATGARGLEAPISLRYLFTGDTAIVARLRRDSQLEKNQRHRLEADVKNFTHLVSSLQHAKTDTEKNSLATLLSQAVSEFVKDYKQDLVYLADIAKQDASLIGELTSYDKGLLKFIKELQLLGFPPEEAAGLLAKVEELSEKFRKDAKQILVTAQSEYRETTSVGQFSYRSSDTLDNIIRRVGRLVNNLHNQIVGQMENLEESKKKADIEETKKHALEAIQLMISELGLIKTVIEDDQVLISRTSRSGQEFLRAAQNVASRLQSKQRSEINSSIQDLVLSQTKLLAGLRQTAQQIVFEGQSLGKAA